MRDILTDAMESERLAIQGKKTLPDAFAEVQVELTKAISTVEAKREELRNLRWKLKREENRRRLFVSSSGSSSED